MPVFVSCHFYANFYSTGQTVDKHTQNFLRGADSNSKGQFSSLFLHVLTVISNILHWPLQRKQTKFTIQTRTVSFYGLYTTFLFFFFKAKARERGTERSHREAQGSGARRQAKQEKENWTYKSSVARSTVINCLLIARVTLSYFSARINKKEMVLQQIIFIIDCMNKVIFFYGTLTVNSANHTLYGEGFSVHISTA